MILVTTLNTQLKHWFGFDTFKPGQEDIIRHILDRKDTLGILPTGSGKSLCYQLPTYINQQPTLIISPLISLMDDQVMQMKMHGEKSIAYVHSGMNEQERQFQLNRLPQSRFIFLSPEFISQPQHFKRIAHIPFGLIVLDEAHCISEWGFDFRPHYALMGRVVQHFQHVPVLALTATAPKHLEQDLQFVLQRHFEVIRTTLNRPNIYLSHYSFTHDDEKTEWLLHAIENSGPTIIYVSSKKKCLALAQIIYESGHLTGIYHGDLDYQERQTVQSQFINNDISIIVATSAFGMGINKKDVRTVIHYHVSTNPSSYLQEIGRAGRDGQQSQAISLYQPEDAFLLENLLLTDHIQNADIDAYELGQWIPPEKADILQVLHQQFSFKNIRNIFSLAYQRKQQGLIRMLAYASLDQCRRKYLLSYFGEHIDSPEHCCDIDGNAPHIHIKNRKKVIRQMDFREKLENLFEI